MSTFASILNRDCEGVMALEIGCSFSISFLDSFSGSLLSPSFSLYQNSELETPTSPKGPNLFVRASMRRAILQVISTNFSSKLENISYVAS
jgi:hypothetical protein